MTSGPLLFDRYLSIKVDTLSVSNLRCSFKVERTLSPEPNTAEIKVLNLSGSERAQIEQYRRVPVEVDAGYQDAHGVIFLGHLRTGYSTRSGSDIVTVLASGSGEYAYRKARTSRSIPPKTKPADVIRLLVQDLGVDPGNTEKAVAAIGKAGLPAMFDSGTILAGSAAREMTRVCQACGLTWSIQDGKIQILPLRTALQGQAIELTPDTGLVGEPSLDNMGVVKGRALMIPDMMPGRKIVVNDTRVKGQFRLEKVTHAGDTHAQDWYVDFEGRRY